MNLNARITCAPCYLISDLHLCLESYVVWFRRVVVRYMCVDLGDLIFKKKTYTTVEGRPLVGDPRPRQKCREALLLANESSITLDFHSLCFRLRKYRPNEDAAYGLIKQLRLPTCCNASLYARYRRTRYGE